MPGQLKITLKRSVIGRVPKHRRTVKALGLRKLGGSVIHQDTPQIRGMIRTIDFLIEVEEV
ncbi:MAG TPA: 50S ribosomal protein L30 [bacterium]|nr:50S ribosomal protein L30 [bacterium]HPO07667.1 50S ribosomal protein L30 [bacterium]HQO33984.1 50S ribosomal protein L30 [bacterium]HQQ00314.1 50S ribosomal protein L30 [bacterium]